MAGKPWSTGEDAALRVMLADGWGRKRIATAIATRFGRQDCTPIAVGSRMNHLGLTMPRSTPNWDDPRELARLFELNDEGLSAAQIAAQLNDEFDNGRTRPSVIGTMWRRGIRSKSGPQTQRIASRAARPQPPARPPKPRVVAVASAPAPRAVVIVLTGDMPTVMQLGPHVCKWPLGEVPRFSGEQRFCGRFAEGIYCREHFVMSRRVAA